jgi:hypothetical protein
MPGLLQLVGQSDVVVVEKQLLTMSFSEFKHKFYGS